MFAALLLAAPLLQAGAPPILGPSGGAMRIVDVSEVGGATQILTMESLPWPANGKQCHVYTVDAQGTLILDSSLPDPTVVRDVHAIEGNRVVCRDSQNYPRVLEKVGSTWVMGGQLQPDFVHGTWLGPRRWVDVGGAQVAHYFPGASGITVQDLSVLGAPVTELTIPFSATASFLDLAMDQDLLVVPWGAYDSNTQTLSNVIVRVFENTPGTGWAELATLQPPSGVDWSDKPLSVDVDSGRIAVANGECGAVFLYERTLAGVFSYASSAVSTRSLEIASDGCAWNGRVILRGDDLVLDTGVDQAGERFTRTSSGWVPQEIVLADEGTYHGYWFAGDFLVSAAGGSYGALGIQTHARVNQPAGIEITCPAPVSAEPADLRAYGLSTFDLRFVSLYLGSVDPNGSSFLVYGFRSTVRPLGPESTLCVGGAVRVVPLPDPSLNQPYTSTFFGFDPSVAGIAAGTTVHFQGWQRLPAVPAGRTSNALAITFAP